MRLLKASVGNDWCFYYVRKDEGQKRRTGRSEREMSTSLVLLRSCEVGTSIRDLDLVLDIWTEKSNYDVKYRRIANQADFDKF